MRGQRTFLVIAVACLLGSAAGFAVDDAESVAPYQYIDPEQFWLHEPVFQKRGIVIEDEDFIVRRRYWVLDRSVHGIVTRVEKTQNGAYLTVRFDEIGAGWQTRGINVQDRVVTNRSATTRIRRDPYRDGTAVDTDEVTMTYRIEGEQVEPSKCGVLLSDGDPEGVFVRFPASLLALRSPKVGDIVVRSWDWHDGFSDGGDAARGPESGCEHCVGVVVQGRDAAGFVNVTWKETGRRKSHRFDHRGFYDIKLAVDR